MSSPADPSAMSALVRDLQALMGAAHVLTGDADRAFFSQDICRAGATVACVVQPGTVDELARTIGLSTARGAAVVPRGGGVSYTGGYLADREATVVVDTRRLDRIVEINADDMYVTVEPGVTWKALYEALRPLGLRTPFWGPLSGAFATIGGSVSQNSILWGSARHGVSAEAVLGLEVVLADGTVLATGSAAVRGARPFFRYYGSDLTGLFLGDCGALGVKARITLQLMRLPACVQTASFGFDSHEAMCAAMAELARAGVVSECFGMDPTLQRQRMKRAGLAKDLRALSGVVSSAKSLAEGMKEAARVAIAGRRFLDGVDYSLHVGAEDRDEAGVSSALAEARRLVAAAGGREVENTVPKVMRGDPFMSLTSGIGPEGERWLPVHGVVRLSDAAATWTAIDALFDGFASRFEQHGVEVGVLTATVGTAFVLEPVFYWPAPRTVFYERIFDDDVKKRFRDFPPNPEGEALVFEARAALTRLFMERGATHFQVGRTYRYREGLKPESWRLLDALKRAVDPHGLVNPGSLGLGV